MAKKVTAKKTEIVMLQPMSGPNVSRSVGDEITVDYDEAVRLRDAKLARFKRDKKPVETAVAKPPSEKTID